jgi:phage-related minor tail protein
MEPEVHGGGPLAFAERFRDPATLAVVLHRMLNDLTVTTVAFERLGGPEGQDAAARDRLATLGLDHLAVVAAELQDMLTTLLVRRRG